MIPHLLIVCRAFLWITFVFSFWGKVRDVPTFTTAIRRFQLLPQAWAKPAALFFLGVEACLILLLSTGAWLEVGFALAFFLLSIFTIALIMALLRKQRTSCHCFGADAHPIGWTDVIRNGGFLLAAFGGWLFSPTASLELGYFLLCALMGIVYGLLWLHVSDIMRLLHTIRQASRPGTVS